MRKVILCFSWLIFFGWNSTALAIDEGEQETNDAQPSVVEYHFPNGMKVDLTDGGIKISNEDGSKSLAVSGQLGLVHSAFGGAYNVDATGEGHFTHITQLQTFRLGFSGNATKDWSYTLQIANRSNGNNDSNDDIYARIAKINYSGWNWATLTIGRGAPYFGTDNMHDSFNEYGTNFALLSDAFSPPTAVGIALQSKETSAPWIWSVGIYHVGSNVQGDARSDLRGERAYLEESHLYIGRAGRIFFDNEAKQRLVFVQTSAYYASGDGKKVHPINVDGGVLGTLAPTILAPITSGPFSLDAKQGRSVVVDVGLSAVNGPFSLETEYAQLHTEFEDILHGSPVYDSAYIQAGWVITGESREFDRSAGYLLGVEPKSSWGALELIGRAENINLSSHAGPENSKTGDKADVFSAGLVWYVNKHVRFAGDFSHMHVTGPFVKNNSGNGGTLQANFFF